MKQNQMTAAGRPRLHRSPLGAATAAQDKFVTRLYKVVQKEGITMMMSNTEYMSDPARVERVVQKVLNLKLKDISEAGGKKQIDFVLEPVIKNEVLVSSMAMNMSFLEFACMVENIGESPDYVFNDHDRYS